MTKQIATCNICKEVVNLKQFHTNIPDWELTCGHLYLTETSLQNA